MAIASNLDLKVFYTVLNEEGFARPNFYRVLFGSLRTILATAEKSAKAKKKYTLGDLAAVVNNIGDTSSILDNQKSILFGKLYSYVANVGLMAKNCNLPSNSLDTTPNRAARGYRQNEITNRNHAPLRMTFYCSESRSEWLAMKTWFDYIFDDETSEVAFPNKYYCTVYIFAYDHTGSVRTSSTYAKVYPINIGSVEMGYENGNQILTFDVEFEYTEETSKLLE